MSFGVTIPPDRILKYREWKRRSRSKEIKEGPRENFWKALASILMFK